MEIKTTKEIIEYSFKNQEFNQKQEYPDITSVFDVLVFIEEDKTKWVRVDDIKESIEKIMRIMSDMDLQLDTLRRKLSQSSNKGD